MVFNDISVKFWIELVRSSVVFAGCDVGVTLYVLCTRNAML